MDYASSRDSDNKWFAKQGQPLPEINMHLTETEREELRENALKGHRCEYVQYGPMIKCFEGDNEHGKVIGPSKMLVKTENNIPILTDYTVSG